MTDPDYPQNTQWGPASPEDEDSYSLSDLFTIMLDEWRTMLIPFVVAIVFALVYVIVVVPTYTASGILQVSSRDSASADSLLEFAAGRPSSVETEVEILRSRRIAARAIQSLSLAVTQKQRKYTLDLSVSLKKSSPIDPTLKLIRNKISKLTVADWVNDPITAEMGILPDGSVQLQFEEEPKVHVVPPGGQFDESGVSFTVKEGPGLPQAQTTEVLLLPEDIATEDVSRNLSIASVGNRRGDTNLVTVQYESVDRTIARDFVNALMEAYMSFSQNWRTQSADLSAEFIEKQINDMRLNLERSEQAVQEFIEQQGAVLLPEQAKELIVNASNLELDKRKVKIQENLLRMAATSLNRKSRDGRSATLTGDFMFEDRILGEAIGALNQLQMKREALLAEVTVQHPEVVRLSGEIERVQEQVGRLIKDSKHRIGQRGSEIDREMQEIHKDLTKFPHKQRQLAALQRNQEVSQEMYRFLMTKLEEARILQASTTTDKRIIDMATTPFKITSPKRVSTLVIALFLGILAGFAAVYIRRAIDPRIRDEEETRRLSKLATYGVIPDFVATGLPKPSTNAPDVVWQAPKGPIAEAFRTIRTNIEFAQVGDEQSLKVLQITSSEASEGKSTIISNLGVALSKAGHRVLIVDLDLRRPSQHRIWEVPRTPGISDHLVGHTDVVPKTIKNYGLKFVSAGNEPPESQRLLGSKELKNLIGRWKEEYDYVLLDTPPLLVADSLVISPHSDMMLFVVRPRHCRRANLRLAELTLNKMDLVKGLIINGVVTRRGGYYHYYRGSYYGSRTSDTQET